ncbi:hypothetical protein BN11_4180007 [Nostocoides australiense Ben110]|uniref:Uncharacterized protein n=1 Tax=Nostocoides australiense Ben110 TaxID=1193182 RepID=W6JZV3_9MICO|nr:hypothetical protein BN11_4180007 [Tetrasphaera australiensis Ben110]
MSRSCPALRTACLGGGQDDRSGRGIPACHPVWAAYGCGSAPDFDRLPLARAGHRESGTESSLASGAGLDDEAGAWHGAGGHTGDPTGMRR